jgi:hypothetical protein
VDPPSTGDLRRWGAPLTKSPPSAESLRKWLERREHAAILAPGVWDRVQSLITHPAPLMHARSRNKHLALLGGLLYCESCAARMVYSYSRKNDRTYPYYVCLNAQRKGWAICPAKSLSARAIEESVLNQLRQTQPASFGAAEWEQMDRTRQVQVMGDLVERVGYDGAARQISIRFRAAGEEVPA